MTNCKRSPPVTTCTSRRCARTAATYGTPTWIWSVVVDGALYARAYNGRNSRWHRAALSQKAGRITAAGMTKEVVFEPFAGAVNDAIDEADRTNEVAPTSSR